MVFHIWMWELDHKEGWELKNWCFRIVVLETSSLQRDQTSPSSKKSTLNIHWKDCCWSWSSSTLATWCKEELTHWKRPLKVGKIESNKRRRRQRMIWLKSYINSNDMNLSKLWETVKDKGASHAAVHGVTKSQIQLSDWTTTTKIPQMRHSTCHN